MRVPLLWHTGLRKAPLPTRGNIRRAFARTFCHTAAPHEHVLYSSRFQTSFFIQKDEEVLWRRSLLHSSSVGPMSELLLPVVLLQATVAGMALGNPLADPAGAAKFALGAGPKAFWGLAKKVPGIGKLFASGVCSSGEWLGAAFARALAASAKDSEKGECFAAFKETHWWIKEFGEGEHGPVKQFYKTLLDTKDAEVAGCFGAAWSEGELAAILAEPTGALATNHLERLRSSHLDGCPEEFQTWFILWVRDELPSRFMDEVHQDPPTTALWHSLQLQCIAAQVGDFGTELAVAQKLTRELAQFTADVFKRIEKQSLSSETVSRLDEFAMLVPEMIKLLAKFNGGDGSAFVCLEVWQPIVQRITDHTTAVGEDGKAHTTQELERIVLPTLSEHERERERNDAVEESDRHLEHRAETKCEAAELKIRAAEKELSAANEKMVMAEAALRLANEEYKRVNEKVARATADSEQAKKLREEVRDLINEKRNKKRDEH